MDAKMQKNLLEKVYQHANNLIARVEDTRINEDDDEVREAIDDLRYTLSAMRKGIICNNPNNQ